MNSVVRMIQLIPPTNRCRDLWDGCNKWLCFQALAFLYLRCCHGLRRTNLQKKRNKTREAKQTYTSGYIRFLMLTDGFTTIDCSCIIWCTKILLNSVLTAWPYAECLRAVIYKLTAIHCMLDLKLAHSLTQNGYGRHASEGKDDDIGCGFNGAFQYDTNPPFCTYHNNTPLSVGDSALASP